MTITLLSMYHRTQLDTQLSGGAPAPEAGHPPPARGQALLCRILEALGLRGRISTKGSCPSSGLSRAVRPRMDHHVETRARHDRKRRLSLYQLLGRQRRHIAAARRPRLSRYHGSDARKPESHGSATRRDPLWACDPLPYRSRRPCPGTQTGRRTPAGARNASPGDPTDESSRPSRRISTWTSRWTAT